jgi:hypothetical protein
LMSTGSFRVDLTQKLSVLSINSNYYNHKDTSTHNGEP